jgi:hypothetical protein
MRVFQRTAQRRLSIDEELVESVGVTREFRVVDNKPCETPHVIQA